ncbi:DUF4397 domain-containing protein [Chitinophaga qingshengii]|uniref:DUF4397 domain-containing protein n=1 Tax=Chitinophaga qingshengii TaxID=1569794 RepID=A0ABR7TVN5_9BACT|nr:DUF4397 domain-containing protein [Chitinophaga qingshengii]MBC9934551.1 DUF4397 domain-containing protein [Chitinophaga qingshengii]
MKKLLFVVMGWLIVMTACKKDSDSAIPVTSSNFMFFNGIPDAVYDVLLDSIKIAQGVKFGTNTPYATLRAQMYTIYLIEAHRPKDTIRAGQINLRNKRSFSAYVGVDSANKVNVIRTLEDDLTPPPPDYMKFRVVSFSQSFRANGQSLAIDLFSRSSPYFRGIGFAQVTPVATLIGDSTYNFNFRRNDDTTVITSTLDFKSQPGKIYTLVTVGNALSSTTFKTFTITHNQ